MNSGLIHELMNASVASKVMSNPGAGTKPKRKQTSMSAKGETNGIKAERKDLSRNRYSTTTKLMCVLEAFKSERRQVEIARKYGVSAPLISIWKKRAIRGIIQALSSSGSQSATLEFGEEEFPAELDGLLLHLQGSPHPVAEERVEVLPADLKAWMMKVERRLAEL